MITVRMIQYWNDYHKKELRERFRSLDELADWIFNQMRADYTSERGKYLLSFPKCDTDKGIYRISVMPEYGEYEFWINQIEEEDAGIIFSDGTFTAGRKHCTKRVREWLAGCEERKKNPTFHFASDEKGRSADFKEDFMPWSADKDFKGDYVPGRLVKRAIREIYNAGGCDAGDEYSEGYDAAIELALDILMKETGCEFEDALEDVEDKEAVQGGSKYL